MLQKEISLLEALTGVDFALMHLDGRMVRVMSQAGEVIQPNSIMTVEGLGMPFHKTNYKHGNLFINFSIKFPDTVTP
jgi:DnaJ family protein A protein 2